MVDLTHPDERARWTAIGKSFAKPLREGAVACDTQGPSAWHGALQVPHDIDEKERILLWGEPPEEPEAKRPPSSLARRPPPRRDAVRDPHDATWGQTAADQDLAIRLADGDRPLREPTEERLRSQPRAREPLAPQPMPRLNDKSDPGDAARQTRKTSAMRVEDIDLTLLQQRYQPEDVGRIRAPRPPQMDDGNPGALEGSLRRPTSAHRDQRLPSSHLEALRQGQDVALRTGEGRSMQDVQDSSRRHHGLMAKG